MIFLHVFRNIITTFLVSLLGNTNPGDDAKKCQQVFLAPLLGMDLKTPYLVIAFRNANKHFWRHCRGMALVKRIF
jgi:hypothetical protein